MSKVHATRTYAPLQFEALEPHRFEDLVRDLIYDYRDWQTIEATGRSGGDDGYDIRAFEKRLERVSLDDDAETTDDQSPALEGNRWMIQCKREKELGPTRVKAIIEDAVRKDDPPYGYILAAPATFSKKAYDAFRTALVERGVQEFHLFGRAELEDMLYMPKNDRILFAFFGVSFASRKRTRVSEIRSTVNNKNKLFSILDAEPNNPDLSRNVLVRDVKDTHYPDKEEYSDFDEKPHWKEYIATRFYPEGVRFSIREHFAYIDLEKKEWDVSPAFDLVYRQFSQDDDKHKERFELRQNAQSFWERLPKDNQAKFFVDGIILYSNFLLIDKQGDSLYPCPHLFVDFAKRGPFDGHWQYLKQGHDSYRDDEFKRVDIFPKQFSKKKFGRIYKDRDITLSNFLVARLINNETITVYDLSNKYDFLKPTDAIHVSGGDEKYGKIYLEVTHRFKTTLGKLYKRNPGSKWAVEEQGGKVLSLEHEVNVLEVKQVYEHELNRG